MSRFALVLVVLGAFAMAEAFPYRQDDIASAAIAGNWDEVHRLLRLLYQREFNLSNVGVKDLQKPPGGHVYAEEESSYMSANDKGVQSGGYRITNSDGVVKEYQLTPTANQQ